MKTKHICVNEDDYNIVQLIKNELKITEPEAAGILGEIGLYTFISYPTGLKHIDDILGVDKFKTLISKLKASYTI